MRFDNRRFFAWACVCTLVALWGTRAPAVENGGSTLRAVSLPPTGMQNGSSHEAKAAILHFQIGGRSNTQPAGVSRRSTLTVVAAATDEPPQRQWAEQASYVTSEPVTSSPERAQSPSMLSPASHDAEASRPSEMNANAVQPATGNASASPADTVGRAFAGPARSMAPPARPQVAPMRLPADLPLTSQARQTLDYFGGYSARATLSQMPRRAPIRPSTTQRTKPQSKPFNVISQDPTVSPYLNLHRNEEDNEAAPNYYSFVRPQIEQLESNRRQRLEVERLERQLQSRSSSAVMPQSGDGGWPAANSAARYMDTAQFYGGWPR